MFDSLHVQQAYLLQNLHSDSEAHAASYSMGTVGSLFTRG